MRINILALKIILISFINLSVVKAESKNELSIGIAIGTGIMENVKGMHTPVTGNPGTNVKGLVLDDDSLNTIYSLSIDYNKYNWLYKKAKASVKVYEAEYNNAKTQTIINLLELNRMKALKNSSAFNEAKFDTLINLNEIRKSNEIKALAELETSKYNLNIAKLDLRNSESRALYDGVLEEKYIEQGEIVSIGTKMFNMISKKDLEIFPPVCI